MWIYAVNVDDAWSPQWVDAFGPQLRHRNNPVLQRVSSRRTVLAADVMIARNVTCQKIFQWKAPGISWPHKLMLEVGLQDANDEQARAVVRDPMV